MALPQWDHRIWNAPAPVVAAAWARGTQQAAFALGNGAVMLTSDASAPGQEPAPACLPLHDGSCLALEADVASGWLTAGDDGRVLHLEADGRCSSLVHRDSAWIELLAAGMTGERAYVVGRRLVCLLDRRTVEVELSAPATAIAFDPAGHRLAAAHHGGVTLWTPADNGMRKLPAAGYPRSLSWSPDGRYLVAGLQENGLHGWRIADGSDFEMGGYQGQPLSLSFASNARFLATSGALRPVCWRFDPPRHGEPPLECGTPGRTPVTRVACHPWLPLIAAGHHSGGVLLCSPAAGESIPLRLPVLEQPGEINALVWSADGRKLAFGSQSGAYGWVGLPQAMLGCPPVAVQSPVRRRRT